MEGQVAPSEDQEGLVYVINPKGNVKIGSTIEIRYYTDIPEVVIPAPTPITVTETGPYLAGDTVSFDFPAYTSCPVGQELSGYNFIFTNGAALANPVDATLDIGRSRARRDPRRQRHLVHRDLRRIVRVTRLAGGHHHRQLTLRPPISLGWPLRRAQVHLQGPST